MGNTRLSNKIYIDSTGEVIDTTVKIAAILFTPDAAGDQMVLRETQDGADIFIVRGAVAKDTLMFHFNDIPMVFQNGIYVQTLTSGAKAVLVTTSTGAK